MNKPFIILLIFVLSSAVTFNAQDQIENSDFENWENVGSNDEEPTDWSSVKSSDNSFLSNTAPQVVFRSNDAHSGSYSLKLKNETIFGIVANGIATTGRVHAETNPNNAYVFTDQNNADYNQSFTAKPDSLTGWYKYSPQGNDKADIQALLHSGYTEIPTNDQSNWIAIAKKEFSGNNSNWVRFSTPFNYLNNTTPSFIISVVSSGDSTIAIDGSELLIDDLSLVYNTPTNVYSTNFSAIKLWYYDNTIHFDELNINTQYLLNIYDLTGKIISRKVINYGEHNYNIHNIKGGIYIAEINALNSNEKKSIKIRK
tara:strand:- start:1279 stop:2217 length:939 start_codon:yes stop_codon:yes gene_type:complete